jgi:8-oxo-dGTP diphosphatase
MSSPVVPRLRSGVKAVVTRGKRVLLTRERRSDGSTFYSLPGGGVESGETPLDALTRELREELDCAGTIGKRVGSCSYQHQRIDATTAYELYVVTLDDAPTPNPSEGIVGVELHDPAALPESMLQPLAQAVRYLSKPRPAKPGVRRSSLPVLTD